MSSLREQAQAIADSYRSQPTVVPKNRGGRPSILTDDLIDQASALIREGHYVEAVANALRIGKSSFYRWLEQGQADLASGHDSTAHARFWDAVKEAEGWAEIDNGREWRAGGQFWAKNATWAERRYPERWSKRADDSATPKVVVQIGVSQGDVQVTLSPPNPQQLPEVSTG